MSFNKNQLAILFISIFCLLGHTCFDAKCSMEDFDATFLPYPDQVEKRLKSFTPNIETLKEYKATLLKERDDAVFDLKIIRDFYIRNSRIKTIAQIDNLLKDIEIIEGNINNPPKPLVQNPEFSTIVPQGNTQPLTVETPQGQSLAPSSSSSSQAEATQKTAETSSTQPLPQTQPLDKEQLQADPGYYPVDEEKNERERVALRKQQQEYHLKAQRKKEQEQSREDKKKLDKEIKELGEELEERNKKQRIEEQEKLKQNQLDKQTQQRAQEQKEIEQIRTNNKNKQAEDLRIATEREQAKMNAIWDEQDRRNAQKESKPAQQDQDQQNQPEITDQDQSQATPPSPMITRGRLGAFIGMLGAAIGLYYIIHAYRQQTNKTAKSVVTEEKK